MARPATIPAFPLVYIEFVAKLTRFTEIRMKLTAPLLEHATALLRETLRFREPADGVVSRYFRENHRLGAGDRALIAEMVFHVLRRKASLEAIVGSAAPRPLLLASLVRQQGANLRELQDLTTEKEMGWLKQVKAASEDDLPLAARLDWPEWLLEQLAPGRNEAELEKLARALRQQAPLDLRVNTLLARRDEVQEALAAAGWHAEETPYAPTGLRLQQKVPLQKHPLFVEGKIEVQDEGSQLLGYLLSPKRTDMVVDFCAGAGGKTLLLGALMGSKGRLYAFDVAEHRLNKLKPRLKRSGLSNVTAQRIEHENDTRVKRLQGKIDRVLVDAPCSGTGTLRRNPDLKWRQTPEAITELTRKQAAIVDAAARLLKPGGRLVYATCSLLEQENEAIAQAFLQSHPEFELEPAADILASHRIPLDTGHFLKLDPATHGTDGFFAAVFKRK